MAQNSVYYSMNVSWGGTSGQVTGTLTGDNYVQISDSTVTATTDKQYNCAVDVSGLTGFFLISTYAITVETNSGSAADYTWTLVANVPQFWFTGTGGTNPLSDDITALYVTNASGSTAQYSFFFIGDNSP